MFSSAAEKHRYEIHQLKSLLRRVEDSEARRKTKRRRLLLAPSTVVGFVLGIYWITQPYPVEQWYLGLASVVLVVPFLALFNA